MITELVDPDQLANLGQTKDHRWQVIFLVSSKIQIKVSQIEEEEKYLVANLPKVKAKEGPQQVHSHR